MLRPGLLLALLLTAGSALAQTDLALTLSASKSSVLTGERFQATVTVRNKTNAEAFNVLLGFTVFERQQLVTLTPPPGWECDPSSDPETLHCSTLTLAPNAQVEFPISVLARNDLPSNRILLQAGVGTVDIDSTPGDNSQEIEVAFAQHPSTTALSIRGIVAQPRVLPTGRATVTLDVRNDGPNLATNVTVRSQISFDALAPEMHGIGWTCTGLTCTRASLAAGQAAPITLTFGAQGEQFFIARSTVGAELSFDPSGADNFTTYEVAFGDASAWTRILIPIVMADTPGANGSLWRAETTGYVDHASMIDFQPPLAICIPRFGCNPLQPRKPFEVVGSGLVNLPATLPTAFIYVRPGDAQRFVLNQRVRDMARQAETWGTEIPIVREHEFRTSTITLLPLPFDPAFRQTLRVYDADAVPGARVAVHVYADGETTPRATLVRTFATTPETVTTALLPLRPGYLQLDPLAEAGAVLAGATRATIRIEPLTPGLRFWGFVSVTNNATGHVTTITP